MVTFMSAQQARLKLDDVTICTIASTNVELSARAVGICTAQCQFGDALLFSHQQVDGPFNFVSIGRLDSRASYGDFLIQKLPEYVRTPFLLLVQWDGYVTDPMAWMDDFRLYDYLGARWFWFNDGLTVGNGGFSLRSKRLIDILAREKLAMDTSVEEDVLICRVHRPMLERKYGIRFAPETIADRFSYERADPTEPTFGFHGLFNFWRHVNDSEIADIVNRIDPGVVGSRQYMELLVAYFQMRKWAPLRAMFRRVQGELSPEKVERSLDGVVNPNETAGFVQTLHRIL